MTDAELLALQTRVVALEESARQYAATSDSNLNRTRSDVALSRDAKSAAAASAGAAAASAGSVASAALTAADAATQITSIVNGAIYRGDWVIDTDYVVGDWVSHELQQWVAIDDSTAAEPGVDETAWEILPVVFAAPAALGVRPEAIERSSITLRINAAVEAAAEGKGKSTVIIGDTYDMTAPLVPRSGVLIQGVRSRRDGLKAAAGTNPFRMILQDETQTLEDVEIRGLKIDANTDNRPEHTDSQSPIHMLGPTGSKNLKLVDLDVGNASQTSMGIRAGGWEGVEFDDVKVHDLGLGLYHAVYLIRCGKINVRKYLAEDIGGSGFKCDGAGVATDEYVKIEDFTARRCDTALNLADIYYSQVSGFTAEDIVDYCISYSRQDDGPSQDHLLSNFIMRRAAIAMRYQGTTDFNAINGLVEDMSVAGARFRGAARGHIGFVKFKHNADQTVDPTGFRDIWVQDQGAPNTLVAAHCTHYSSVTSGTRLAYASDIAAANVLDIVKPRIIGNNWTNGGQTTEGLSFVSGYPQASEWRAYGTPNSVLTMPNWPSVDYADEAAAKAAGIVENGIFVDSTTGALRVQRT
jgi:hypothetical protein